jgi:hypothetical protein
LHAKNEQRLWFTFALHHLPPARHPAYQVFLKSPGLATKPHSFSGREAETATAKLPYAHNRIGAHPWVAYFARFANPVKSITNTS